MTFNFAMQAMDQIINSAAKTLYMSGGQMGCSIVFRGPNGAAARVAAQHSQDYSAWYSHIPGLKVIAPYDRGRRQGPAQGRDPRSQSGDLPRKRNPLRPVARRCRSSTISCCRSARRAIARAGNDVTIVAWSMGMTYALKAAEELAKEGIDAEVIDLRTLRPMDTETIVESVKKTGRCVTVEEGWPQSGVGAEIAARVMEQRLRLSRRAGRARVRQGRADALRRQSGKARAAVGRRGGRGGESRLLSLT